MIPARFSAPDESSRPQNSPMPKHVVAPVDDIPPGGRKLVAVNGRAVVVFNLGGEFFALNNRCPHNGGSLCEGKQTGLIQSSEPGEYRYSRRGEIIRCPWHSWEFISAPAILVRPAAAAHAPIRRVVEKGAQLVEGPYKAETFPVSVENDYIVVEA